jgi:hypothetical protein
MTCFKTGKFCANPEGPKINHLQVSNICCKSLPRLPRRERMDKTIRKYAGIAALDEIKAQEYRYWQSRPVHERIEAVSEPTPSYVRDEGHGSRCTPTPKNSCPLPTSTALSIWL